MPAARGILKWYPIPWYNPVALVHAIKFVSSEDSFAMTNQDSPTLQKNKHLFKQITIFFQGDQLLKVELIDKKFQNF